MTLQDGVYTIPQGKYISEFMTRVHPDLVNSNFILLRHKKYHRNKYWTSPESDPYAVACITEAGLKYAAESEQKASTVIRSYLWTCKGDGNCERACGQYGHCNPFCPADRLTAYRLGHCCKVRVDIKQTLQDLRVGSGVVSVRVEGRHTPEGISYYPPERKSICPIVQKSVKELAGYQNLAASTVLSRLVATESGRDTKNTQDPNASQEVDEKNVKAGRFVPTLDQIQQSMQYERRKVYRPAKLPDWEQLDDFVRNTLSRTGAVLLYRPTQDEENHFILVLALQRNLELARTCASAYVSVDARWDSNRYKAPLSSLVAKDEKGGSICVAHAITDRENTETASEFVNTVRYNIPCTDPECTHPWDMENSDGELRRVTPCAMGENFQPMIGIDKSQAQKNAADELGLPTSLGDWHDKVSFTEHCVQTLGIKDEAVLHDLLMCFCYIRRSVSEDDAHERFEELKTFMMSSEKLKRKAEEVTEYLDKNWMCPRWLSSIIDQRFIDCPEADPTQARVEVMHRALERQASRSGNIVNLVSSLIGVLPNGDKMPSYVGVQRMTTVLRAQRMKSPNPAAEPKDIKLARLRGAHIYLKKGCTATRQASGFYVKKGVATYLLKYKGVFNGNQYSASTVVNGLLGMLVPESKSREGFYYVQLDRKTCQCYQYLRYGCHRKLCSHLWAAHYNAEVQQGKLTVEDVKRQLSTYIMNSERTSSLKLEGIYGRRAELSPGEVIASFEAAVESNDSFDRRVPDKWVPPLLKKNLKDNMGRSQPNGAKPRRHALKMIRNKVRRSKRSKEDSAGKVGKEGKVKRTKKSVPIPALISKLIHHFCCMNVSAETFCILFLLYRRAEGERFGLDMAQGHRTRHCNRG